MQEQQNSFEPEKQASFESELASLVNKYSRENGSNTPDFLLAKFLADCLFIWDRATKKRDAWFNVQLRPGDKKFL